MAIICDICREQIIYSLPCPRYEEHETILATRYAEALIQIAVEHGPRLRENSYHPGSWSWSSPSDVYWVAAVALGVA